MRRWLLVLAACGGGTPATPDAALPHDRDGAEPICVAECGCQVLTQTGCDQGDKCSWVLSTDDIPSAPGLGSITCASDGTKAVGAACTRGTVAQGGADDCVAGAICIDGTCEQICDNTYGSLPCPSGRACIAHESIFANIGSTTTPAGVCDVACDPLDDNDFDGSGSKFTKAGSACGSDPTVGCYGRPSVYAPTVFGCARPLASTAQLTHRAPVEGNAQTSTVCMPGYEAGSFYDDTGLVTLACLAWCKPGDAYNGNVNANAPNGVAPHRCNTTDALGAFGTAATDTVNGEHCMYSWRFEVDYTNAFHRSATSDTLGICIDHTQYQYDVDGNGTLDAPLPACGTLPLADAATFGCVSTALAMPAFGKPRRYIQLPELR